MSRITKFALNRIAFPVCIVILSVVLFCSDHFKL